MKVFYNLSVYFSLLHFLSCFEFFFFFKFQAYDKLYFSLQMTCKKDTENHLINGFMLCSQGIYVTYKSIIMVCFYGTACGTMKCYKLIFVLKNSFVTMNTNQNSTPVMLIKFSVCWLLFRIVCLPVSCLKPFIYIYIYIYIISFVSCFIWV